MPDGCGHWRHVYSHLCECEYVEDSCLLSQHLSYPITLIEFHDHASCIVIHAQLPLGYDVFFKLKGMKMAKEAVINKHLQ